MIAEGAVCRIDSHPACTWEEDVDALWVDYEFPQDGGNRCDVRWVEFLGGGGGGSPAARPRRDLLLRARFGGLDGASFAASHYTVRDVDECTHPFELRKHRRDDTIVRLDFVHHGLGTGSCGPSTLPQYQLRTNREFDYEVILD